MERSFQFFFHFFTQRETEEAENDKGRVVGGESLFGRLAMMRTKLGLTESEIMNSSWIYLNLMMYDIPYYDYKGKEFVRGKKADEALKKYISHE